MSKTQIRKARGGNKKMMKPQPKLVRAPIDFCYVAQRNGSVKFSKAFEGIDQKWFGLVRIAHMKDNYHVFIDPQVKKIFDRLSFIWKHDSIYSHNLTSKEAKAAFKRKLKKETAHLVPLYRGVIKEGKSKTVILSSIPKNENSIGVMSYNMSDYTKHCQEHKSYWVWVKERNPERYKDNMLNGNGYDVKNMQHCIRLLQTATEIFTEKKINVRRPNRDFLLSIRQGKRTFDEIMEIAKNCIDKLEVAYKASDLPMNVTKKSTDRILLQIRKELL